MLRHTALPPVERGASAQAIGCTKGGRNTKVHAISDEHRLPLVFYLTPGQTAGIKGAVMLSACLPRAKYLLADKAYDANHWRDHLKARRIQPVIPNKSNRVQPHRFNKARYKGRNVNERMFRRLKDFCRIATQYDKDATNFLTVLYLAALICYWI